MYSIILGVGIKCHEVNHCNECKKDKFSDLSLLFLI